MGTAWGPGRYGPSAVNGGQSQTAGGTAGQGCDCNGVCCIAKAETHYAVTKNSGTTAVDGPGNGKTLSNRASMEFVNAGSNSIEVNNVPFTFGDGTGGRLIVAGGSWAIQVGPSAQSASLKHYVQSASGTFDCRITELGL